MMYESFCDIVQRLLRVPFKKTYVDGKLRQLIVHTLVRFEKLAHPTHRGGGQVHALHHACTVILTDGAPLDHTMFSTERNQKEAQKDAVQRRFNPEANLQKIMAMNTAVDYAILRSNLPSKLQQVLNIIPRSLPRGRVAVGSVVFSDEKKSESELTFAERFDIQRLLEQQNAGLADLVKVWKAWRDELPVRKVVGLDAWAQSAPLTAIQKQLVEDLPRTARRFLRAEFASMRFSSRVLTRSVGVYDCGIMHLFVGEHDQEEKVCHGMSSDCLPVAACTF
jgi:hypothetical protein